MEVLSCSDVHHVSKSSYPQGNLGTGENYDEGTTLILADCSPQKTSGSDLSLDINKGEQLLMELDYAEEIPCVDQSNGAHEKQDVVCSLQFSNDELFNGVSLQLDCRKNCIGDEPSNNTHERGPVMNSSKQTGCDLANGILLEDKLSKVEDGNHGRTVALAPCSNLLDRAQLNCLDQGFQMSDSTNGVNKLFLGKQVVRKNEQSEGKGIEDAVLMCETFTGGTSYLQHKGVENLHYRSSNPSNELNQSKLDVQKETREFFARKEECELPDGDRGTEGGPAETEFPEQDVTTALWVKCMGKWQAGICCSRVDWPLSTLKMKPTNARKKYCVVFLPHTSSHSWADMLLVRPINELPEPLAYGTHDSELEMVKDLTTPRRYIMHELVVAMLNVSEQLHTEALVEKARQVTAWKKFAMEAYRCKGYPDLGKMLMKLQSMILPAYLDPDWLQHSFGSWMQRCKTSQTAESVETLTKELLDSVLWDQVEALWDAPIQPELGFEWKTWKQEVMQWFTSHSPTAAIGGSSEQHKCDASSTSSEPHVSKKRPKLEVRRADTHASQVEAETHQVDIDSGFFNGGSDQNIRTAKEEAFTDCLNSGGDGWVEIAVEAGNPDFTWNTEASPPVEVGSSTDVLVDAHHGSLSLNKYRQCTAFIAAKGRQCGRWANDGEVFCCVHLSSNCTEKTARVEQTPPSFSNVMCEGTTNHGERCKHRARFGSLFCKKHRPQDSQMDNGNMLVSPANNLKRKLSETNSSLESIVTPENVTGKEIVLVGDQNQFLGNLNSVSEGETVEEKNVVMEKCTETFYARSSATVHRYNEDWPRCIVWGHEDNNQCPERAKLHTLYCEKHRPNFLKRARNGKSRMISKEHFVSLLRNCSSRSQKVQLHQACELLYGFMKSALNRRNRVSKDSLMEWIFSEVSKDSSVGDYLMKLVSLEKEKIGRIWGFGAEMGRQVSLLETQPMIYSMEAQDRTHNIPAMMKCKICTEDFLDDQSLGAHWMNTHKKEAQWLFRGYACPICMNSFTNRKVLEVHVKEKHGVQSLEKCILFQCMPCGKHFVNPEQLWVHVLSLHSMDFRLRSSSDKQNQSRPEQAASQSTLEMIKNHCPINDAMEPNDVRRDGSHRFVCRFCGLKFDLLPDLGRHHQAAHMGPNATSQLPHKRLPQFHAASRLRPGRPSRSRFQSTLGGGFRARNNTSFSMKRQFHGSNSVSLSGLRLLTQVSEAAAVERSIESQCSSVAEILFKEIQKTKARPANLEILSVARSTCCKVGLRFAMEEKYGVLPEILFLKAARLCSELNIQVEWHQEGFICPRGCKPVINIDALAPLDPLPDWCLESPKQHLVGHIDGPNDGPNEWEMEECHYIISSSHMKHKSMRKVNVLCEDVTFGREQVSVACVVDEDLKASLHSNGSESNASMPWEGFTYIGERLLDPSLGLDAKSSQLGCGCPHPICSPETCDHVYLFDNDYESAKDIFGKPIHGRFPYDEMGRLILEEGYLVYECNSMCSCDKTCHNRVLQNGVQVKLEIFRTEKKGWAVRAGEVIPRGAFVCEYIGEVLSDQEANKRPKRYDHEACSYFYDIDAHVFDIGGVNDGSVPYVIDATKYGNVSRFINHSCSPNLMTYQVLVESMDCQLAHIGLYASRDIAKGEELAYNYRKKLVPGEGCPCYCGASNCRGRLY